MRKLRILLSVGLIFGLFALIPVVQAEQVDPKAAKTEARKAAHTWLGLIDQGDYGESWETAAKLFKEKVGFGQWIKILEAVRSPLGKVLTREFNSAGYSEMLPGAPEGKYVVIQYKTDFETKPGAVETVTPMLDPDGVWRVSGYFIK